MKRWKIILLILLGLLVAAQIPFCARRWQLAAVQNKISEQNVSRQTIENKGFRHYKGVIHVHTSLGGHSAGEFKELISAAAENELDFVLLTEHPEPLFDTGKQTLNGFHGKTLFVGGNEISSKQGDRFLILPGDADANKDTTFDTAELLNRQKSANRLAIITYPENYRAWETANNFDGVEVYSLHTNAKRFPKLFAFFDYFWSFGAFPELTMARNFERPNANLQKFDELTATGKRLTLFGAADAHSNIGIRFSDRADHDWLKIQIDPYKSIFKLVRLHVWLPADQEFNQENLLAAIKNANCYTAFDVYGSADDFVFYAENSGERKIMGDEIALANQTKLVARAALKSRFVLYKNGAQIQNGSAETNDFTFAVTEPGVYRIELYRDSLELNRAPWIISNPIYVR